MLYDNVRDTCPFCGPVDVRGPAVTILSDVDTEQNIYAFECPRCASPIVKKAGNAVLSLLLRSGAQVATNPWPCPDLGPITDDEVIVFREALARLPTARR